MSPGNLEVVQIVVSWIVTVPAFAAVLAFDERRLHRDEQARAWSPASRAAAIFGTWMVGTIYGAVGVLAHFAKTRRTWRGALIGLLAAAFLLLLDIGAELAAAEVVYWLGL